MDSSSKKEETYDVYLGNPSLKLKQLEVVNLSTPNNLLATKKNQDFVKPRPFEKPSYDLFCEWAKFSTRIPCRTNERRNQY